MAVVVAGRRATRRWARGLGAVARRILLTDNSDEVRSSFERASGGGKTAVFSEAIRIQFVDEMFQERALTLEVALDLWGGDEQENLDFDGFCTWYAALLKVHDVAILSGQYDLETPPEEEFFDMEDCDLIDDIEIGRKLGVGERMQTFAVKPSYAEAKAAIRPEAAVRALFEERCGADGFLASVEALLGVSELASLLSEGALLESELRKMWNELADEEEGTMDLDEFWELLARVDNLFEVEEEDEGEPGEQTSEASAYEEYTEYDPFLAEFHILPRKISGVARAEALKAWRSGAWRLRHTKVGRVAGVRPPSYVAQGRFRNPLVDLREVGDLAYTKVCRFVPGYENVRPSFLDFSVEQIKALVARGGVGPEGLTYLTFGVGGLYFDWELLECLQAEGIKIGCVWIMRMTLDSPRFIQEDKEGFERAQLAAKSFANWFAETNVRVYAFDYAEDLMGWASDHPEDGADVLMQVDTDVEPSRFGNEGDTKSDGRDSAMGRTCCYSKLIDKRDFVRAVARPAALNLVCNNIFHPKQPGPLRRARLLGVGDDEGVTELEADMWQQGEFREWS